MEQHGNPVWTSLQAKVAELGANPLLFVYCASEPATLACPSMSVHKPTINKACLMKKRQTKVPISNR